MSQLTTPTTATQDSEPLKREHLLIINGKLATDEEYIRIVFATPYHYTEAEIKRDQQRYASRPFQLLR